MFIVKPQFQKLKVYAKILNIDVNCLLKICLFYILPNSAFSPLWILYIPKKQFSMSYLYINLINTLISSNYFVLFVFNIILFVLILHFLYSTLN